MLTRSLTLILLMWRIGWAPNNASRWQIGFNSAFKVLTGFRLEPWLRIPSLMLSNFALRTQQVTWKCPVLSCPFFSSSSSSSSSSCSGRIRIDSCSLYPQNEIGPSISSSVRPMCLRPFALYCSACLGILFVSILCMCCSHFSWYCFITFTIFSAPFFP